MKRLSIFVLDSVDRLVEIENWFKIFEIYSIPVQLWLREEDVESARFIAPSATLYALDPRIWTSKGMISWWPQAFAPAFAPYPDEILILDGNLSKALERLLLIFPTQRVTAWLAAHPSRQDQYEDDIHGLRTVVTRIEAVRQRLGLQDMEPDWPWFDSPNIAEEALQFCFEAGFGPGSFLVADLGASNAKIDLSAGAMLDGPDPSEGATNPSNPTKRVVLVHDADVRPARAVEALRARSITVLPVCRQDIGLRVRAGLVYLSCGFIGWPRSAEFRFAKMLKRPILALCGAAEWARGFPALQSGLFLDCSSGEVITMEGATLRISPDYVTAALAYLLSLGADGANPMSLSDLSQHVWLALSDGLRKTEAQSLVQECEAGRRRSIERFVADLSDNQVDVIASRMRQALEILE